METTNLLNETVLSVMQRRKRSINTKRRAPQLKRAREIAARKLAPEETLMRRARLKAKNMLRTKFAGKQGAEYSHLTPAARVQVDKLIEKKLPVIEKLVKRLLPQVRKDERERLKRRRKAKATGSAATQRTKSMVSNVVPIKEMLELAEQVVVDQFVEFLVNADFTAYSQAVPVSVVEDICIDALVLEQSHLDTLIDELTTSYPIMEGIDITPVGSVSDSNIRYVTMYHPEKLHYHVELVQLKPGETVETQSKIADRLSQGYIINNPTDPDIAVGGITKAANRRYRRQVDD